ncbi:DUF2878 domain-containing protein [Marinobacter daepoensis]|uniref:DUF2878 domain-containing protein n=1 Tax=Marinobacter daepoensis TaxID=262077 RepID=UPI000423C8E9|nr:DUF2878 domain-containing protein [Marinobacter daepoensis]MBY6032396.1 DUF2878 domain-containing protein [Marinobacter daepoensis]
MTSGSARNILNFLLFQVGWLACVIYPGLASAGLVVALLMLHFTLVSKQRFAELQFVGFGVVLGGLMDTLWFHAGVLALDSSIEVIAAPPWLIAIWALFMTTLCHSLGWVGQRRWHPWFLAPVAGPFAYWSASHLGIVALPNLTVSLVAMAIGWLLLFPLLLFIRKTLYTELEP